ncbi:hypothetical protein C7M52_00641 [Mixta theicola]|nr:hypothetical protein [Mixta theicola]QHM74699.1 hypothetical protein C7M52_00641 [Mixta theicola]
MNDRFRRRLPQARIHLNFALSAGPARKKARLRLSLPPAGDDRYGRTMSPTSEGQKININKNKAHSVFAGCAPLEKLWRSPTLGVGPHSEPSALAS